MSALAAGVPGTVTLWCDPDSVSRDQRVQDATLPDGVTVTDLVQAASEELFEATGHRWPGFRTDVLRPHRLSDDCGCDTGGVNWTGFDWGESSWWNRQFPEGGCGCAGVSELVLPSPVVAVSIIVDGSNLAADQYQIYDNRRLVRLADPQGSVASWPCCQRLNFAADQPGTWQLTVSWGSMPPKAGQIAAREWSIHKVLQASTDKVKLPQKTTSFARQGVNVTIESGDLLRQGMTGLPLVDSFLTFCNRKSRQRRARSYSPDDITSAISSTSQP